MTKIAFFFLLAVVLFLPSESLAAENLYLDVTKIAFSDADAEVLLRDPLCVKVNFTLGAESKSENDWSKTDVAIQVLANTLHVLDWLQTLEVANHPDEWEEQNFILGKHPSSDEINLYFAGSMIVMNVISLSVPKSWRYVTQGVWIGFEGKSVLANYQLGVRF